MSNTLFYIIITTLIVIACSSGEKNEKDKSEKDDFYERSRGWDYSRIPLIKPYELLRLKGKKEWNMSLHTATLQTGVADIKEINVVNGLIIVHTTEGSILRLSEVSEAWFVITPAKGIEEGFDKKEKFVAYLTSLGIKDPKLHNPDSVYQSFRKTGSIDWEKDY